MTRSARAMGSAAASKARAWPAVSRPSCSSSWTDRRQLQQPQSIRDMGPALADLLGQLLLAAGELVDQPAIALRLFQRRRGRGAARSRRWRAPAPRGRRSGAPAPAPRGAWRSGPRASAARRRRSHACRAGVGCGPHQHRLQDAVAADRLRQGFQLLGIEMPARLQAGWARAGRSADGAGSRRRRRRGLGGLSPSSAERPRPRPRLVSAALMRFPSAASGRRPAPRRRLVPRAAARRASWI